MQMIVSVFLSFAILETALVAAAKQCVTVTGRLGCDSNTPGSTGNAGIKVTMWDADFGRRDDKMGEDTTEIDGTFDIHGCASDPFGAKIEPYLLIEHKCTGKAKTEKVKLDDKCIGKTCRVTYRMS